MSFSWFMGNESEGGTNNSPENHFAAHAMRFVCAPRSYSFPMNQEKKDTHSLNINFIHTIKDIYHHDNHFHNSSILLNKHRN